MELAARCDLHAVGVVLLVTTELLGQTRIADYHERLKRGTQAVRDFDPHRVFMAILAESEDNYDQSSLHDSFSKGELLLCFVAMIAPMLVLNLVLWILGK